MISGGDGVDDTFAIAFDIGWNACCRAFLLIDHLATIATSTSVCHTNAMACDRPCNLTGIACTSKGSSVDDVSASALTRLT